MAVARCVLGRPALPLSSVFSHSRKFASSIDVASNPGLSLEFNAGASRLAQGNDWTISRVSCSAGNFGSFLDSGIRSRKLRTGIFSMATSTSETLSPEEEAEYKIQEQILTHQKAAAKLTKVEEARTLVQQTTLGTLSTISQKYNGSPVGSMVTYATDEDGSIILCITSLSPHTKDLELNPRCSLLVPKDPADKSDTVITIIGEAIMVADQDEPMARTAYLKRHPGAFWVDFADFRFVRIQPKNVRYVSGIVTGLASVGDFTAEQYQAASVDPISQFGPAIAGHMNRDHADQSVQIVENSVGVKVDSALIEDVDRYGFSVRAKRQGRPIKLRIPFPRPAEDRKAVKTLIIEMLTSKDN